MDEQQTSPVSAPAVSSFTTRAANVFAAPGDLYTELASNPVQTSSWLLPFLISLLLAIVFTYAVYNNPALRQQVYDLQSRQFDQAVADGKMTQDRADMARNQMENSGPVMFMIFGAGFASIGIAIMYFGASLILWLVAKIGLKFVGTYTKMLEVFGLAGLISIFGSIITLILANLFDTLFATPSAALAFLGSFDPSNSMHRLLASLNVFTIWQASVLGIGIAKISNKSVGAGIGVSVGLWLLWAVGSSLLGIGGMR